MERSITFNYTANYFISGTINAQTDEIWFVLHGYGQLPKYFIKKFHAICSDKLVVVAPGGLSRFYLEGHNGRVGSTWMTSENRLLDIDNYVNYLQSVYEDVMRHTKKGKVKITLLGFSQGGATVNRWIQSFNNKFERLILWAASFPYDMDVANLGLKLSGKKLQIVIGTKDELVNETRQNEQKDYIHKMGIHAEFIFFEGGHDIHRDTLIRIAHENKL